MFTLHRRVTFEIHILTNNGLPLVQIEKVDLSGRSSFIIFCLKILAATCSACRDPKAKAIVIRFATGLLRAGMGQSRL